MRKLFGFAAVPVLIAASATAQVISTTGGAIQGTITDPSGAALAGAQITVTNTATNAVRTLATDKSGFYAIGPLNPGPYTISVSDPGFQNLTVSTVVRVGTATTGTYKLAVGQSTETIQVNAGALQVNTD